MSALLNNVRNDQLCCTIILDELKALDGASPPSPYPPDHSKHVTINTVKISTPDL